MKDIMERCPCGVVVNFNDHKIHRYASIAEYLDEDTHMVTPAVRAKMEEFDQVVNIDVYPDNPDEFISVYHYDLDMAITAMKQMLIARTEAQQ